MLDTDTPEIKFALNGKQVEWADGSSLLAYLEQTGINPGTVVAEVNGVILKPEFFGAYIINAGDEIEIIHFVGGG